MPRLVAGGRGESLFLENPAKTKGWHFALRASTNLSKHNGGISYPVDATIAYGDLPLNCRAWGIFIDNRAFARIWMGMDGSCVMDWKDRILSSDAARASPRRAQELIALAEAAILRDTRALETAVEDILESDRSDARRATSVHPNPRRPQD